MAVTKRVETWFRFFFCSFFLFSFFFLFWLFLCCLFFFFLFLRFLFFFLLFVFLFIFSHFVYRSSSAILLESLTDKHRMTMTLRELRHYSHRCLRLCAPNSGKHMYPLARRLQHPLTSVQHKILISVGCPTWGNLPRQPDPKTLRVQYPSLSAQI